MVLPRRMLTVGVLGEVNQRPGRPADLYLNIDYGLGRRLELAGLMSLRWAILDEGLAFLPSSVSWLGTSASVAFQW